MIEERSIKFVADTPIVEPVELPETKAWAVVDHTDDDDLIEAMITAARQDVERLTNLKLIPGTVTIYASTTKGEWLTTHYGTPSGLVVSDIDTDGTETVADSDDYYEQANGVYLQGSGDYKITYTVGDEVPQTLKEAIMMLVAYRYNNRGDQEKQHGIPKDIMDKCWIHGRVVL